MRVVCHCLQDAARLPYRLPKHFVFDVRADFFDSYDKDFRLAFSDYAVRKELSIANIQTTWSLSISSSDPRHSIMYSLQAPATIEYC